MSEESTEQEPQAEAEQGEPSRIAGGCVLVILAGVAALILRAVVTVAPYTAYFVAGILTCLAWQKIRARVKKRRGTAPDEAEGEEPPDIAEALRHLGRRGDHVLLTQLRQRLGVGDTKTVRALLKESGIRVRSGVRAPGGNGPGVHQDDIPAPPPEEETPSESGCSCRPEPTTPTPTTGTTAEPIGLAGVVVKDGSEAGRRHTLPQQRPRASS